MGYIFSPLKRWVIFSLFKKVGYIFSLFTFENMGYIFSLFYLAGSQLRKLADCPQISQVPASDHQRQYWYKKILNIDKDMKYW